MSAEDWKDIRENRDSVDPATPSEDASERVSLTGLACFVVAYVLAGGFGQGLSLIPGVSIIFWPPAGVFVGTLLMNARRTWFIWIVAGCVAEMTCNTLWFHNKLPFALLYFGANTLTALASAMLVERFGLKHWRLESLRDVSLLTCLAAGIAPMASATIIAVIDAIIGKHPFTTAWLMVWVGDSTGLLVSTPLTLVAIDRWRHRETISRSVLLEASAMYLLMIIVGFLAMRGYLPTVYLIMPVVIWIATRFLIRGIAVALPLVAIMTAAFTVVGSGEFSGGPELMQAKMLSLQVFLGVCAVSALLVAAVSGERQQAIVKLNAIKSQLERNVEARTVELEQSNQELRDRNTQLLRSEERLRLAVEATGVGIFDFDPQTRRQSFSAEALRLWGFQDCSEPDPELVLNTVHPEDRAKAEEATVGSLDPAGTGQFAIEHRLILPDGSVRWISATGQTQFAGVNGSRRAVRSVGTMLDITERKRTEIELRSSQQRLELGTSVGELALVEIDYATELSHLSREAAKLFGLGEDACVVPRRSLHDVIHPDDRDAILARVVASLDPHGEGGFAMDHRVVHRHDDTVTWARVRYRVFFEGEGENRRPVRAMLAAIDITAERNAQETIRQSEAFIRGVLNALPEHVAVLDARGVIIAVNEPWERFAVENGGTTNAASPLGTNYLELFSNLSPLEEPHARQAYDRLCDLLAGKVDAVAVEYPCHSPEHSRWFLMNARRVRSSGDVVVSHLDVTARKMAEMKVRESEASIQQALRASRSFTFEWDPKTDRVRRSTSCAEILQLTGDDAVSDSGQNFFQRVVAEDRVSFADAISGLTPSENCYTTVYRVKIGDASHVLLEETGQGSFDAAGKLVRLVGVATDITSRQRIEAELRQSQSRQAFLLTLSDALRTLSDPAAIQTEASRVLGEHLQVDRAYYVEISNSEELAQVQREYRRGDMPSLIGEHRLADFGWSLSPMRSGDTIVIGEGEHSPLISAEDLPKLVAAKIAAHVSAPLIKAGELVGALCVAQSRARQWTTADVVLITETAERIWSAVERSKAEAALKESDRRKDEFLATLSHELRNPLATIRSGLEVLRLTPENTSIVTETRDLMLRQVNHLVALVDDLLEISRISRGKLKLRREVVDISEAIDSAVETCRPLLTEAGHELHLELPLDSVHVAGDPHRITQMIANLLNNAAKYTPTRGHITISAIVNEGKVAISVKDTGVGIAKKHLPRIFELFTQVKNESSAYAGLGIGLSLVKSLAEMHGGSITADSDGKNKGSTFTVRLPTCESDKSNSDTMPRAACSSTAPRRRVLVVDDNVGAARTLSIVVQMLGNEVCTAYNGQDALEKGQEFLPEIVIMDIGMPVMDGYAAARAMRETPWGKSIFLIALTGWGQEDDKQRTKDAGFDRHLTKPVEPSVIREILAELSVASSALL